MMIDQDDEIRSLALSNRKIEAIKLYRERYGGGLAEAKDVIDQLAAGQPVAFPTPLDTLRREAPGSGPTDGEFLARVDELIRSGQKIQAIKLYRERTHLGLKEAKDAVDARESQLRLAGHTIQPTASPGCFIATAAFGSETTPEVLALRRFRDRVLLQNHMGRHFVRWYYRWSPPLAIWLMPHPSLCHLTRILLQPIVKFCNRHSR